MKAGAGLLFFAYGGKQLKHFLEEAKTAAKSFRVRNPKVSIAIVSNADSVDNRTFDHHIQPRPDLLFAGSLTNGDWGDKLPRQWLTRLYYLAHSPYEITWALDSNVFACTSSSAQAFLDGALLTGLWGYDIAHANQRDGHMYPHNFNVVYKWSPRTSALLRDWLLLQIRRGVASDDQKTLHFAELRQALAGGLNIGQVATEYAAAFYNAAQFKSVNASDRARITRVLRGPAHVLHSKNPSDCYDFNLHETATRQIVMVAHKPTGAKKSNVSYRTVFSVDECEIALAGGGVTAPLIEARGPLRPARVLCKFRDMGPRISQSLYAGKLAEAQERNQSAKDTMWIRSLLSARRLPVRPRFHGVGNETRVGADLSSPLWPPVIPAFLETYDMQRFFGRVNDLE